MIYQSSDVMIRHDITWYDVILVLWYAEVHMSWYVMISHDMMWYGVIWRCDTAPHPSTHIWNMSDTRWYRCDMSVIRTAIRSSAHQRRSSWYNVIRIWYALINHDTTRISHDTTRFAPPHHLSFLRAGVSSSSESSGRRQCFTVRRWNIPHTAPLLRCVWQRGAYHVHIMILVTIYHNLSQCITSYHNISRRIVWYTRDTCDTIVMHVIWMRYVSSCSPGEVHLPARWEQGAVLLPRQVLRELVPGQAWEASGGGHEQDPPLPQVCPAQVQAQGWPCSGGGERRRRGGGEEESEGEALSIMRISWRICVVSRSYQIVSDRIMTYASVRIRSYRIVSDHIMTCASVRITIISCHITMFSDLAPYQMRIRRYRHVSEWGLVSVRWGHTYQNVSQHITTYHNEVDITGTWSTYQTRIDIYHTYHDSFVYRGVSQWVGVRAVYRVVCITWYHELSHNIMLRRRGIVIYCDTMW